VSEYANQTISFDTEADFEAFKTETGTDDTFYEDVAGGGTGTGDVTKKYVDDNLLLKQNKLTAGAGINITGDTISSTGGATGNFVTLDSYQQITGQKDFQGAAVFAGNAYCFQAPASQDGLINKRYLDERLVDKQAKLTAGTGIDITGDVISATRGGRGSSVVSVDKGETKEYPLIIDGRQVYIYYNKFDTYGKYEIGTTDGELSTYLESVVLRKDSQGRWSNDVVNIQTTVGEYPVYIKDNKIIYEYKGGIG
jgi:hypothetical protein